MIGGFPAAALAMYHCAKKNKRKDVKGLLLSSSLTSILTGITEPLEFTVLFASPFLFWGIHCVLFAFSAVFVSLFKIGVGFTFSGGLLDMILYGVLPGQARTNWLALIPLILFYFALYYFVFRFAILKFNLKTPGREDDEEESTLHTKQDYVAEKNSSSTSTTVDSNDNSAADDSVPAMIVNGLGGKSNISTLEACATRLRVSVKNPDIVKKGLLKSTGAVGTVIHGTGVQVIYGTKVSTIGPEVEDYLGIED
ncbi:hypothetical protein COSHB9_17200 [Companilactobacillus alimentarius]